MITATVMDRCQPGNRGSSSLPTDGNRYRDESRPVGQARKDFVSHTFVYVLHNIPSCCNKRVRPTRGGLHIPSEGRYSAISVVPPTRRVHSFRFSERGRPSLNEGFANLSLNSKDPTQREHTASTSRVPVKMERSPLIPCVVDPSFQFRHRRSELRIRTLGKARRRTQCTPDGRDSTSGEGSRRIETQETGESANKGQRPAFRETHETELCEGDFEAPRVSESGGYVSDIGGGGGGDGGGTGSREEGRAGETNLVGQNEKQSGRSKSVVPL